MNSTVGSIFNEKVAKNKVCGSREQSTTAAKKKEGNVNCETQTRNNVDPNGHLDLENALELLFFFLMHQTISNIFLL